MKNILAENMLRFAPKNLSESDKNKLRSILTEKREVAYAENVLGTKSYTNAVGTPTSVVVDFSTNKYVYFETLNDRNSDNDSTFIKRTFTSGDLVVERNFVGNYTLAAGMPGTIQRANGKFTAGTALKIYMFTGDPLNPEEESEGSDNLQIGTVSDLSVYNGTTKNGSTNAAAIAVSAVNLVSGTKLRDLWSKLVEFNNKLVEAGLSTEITDANKNAIYQDFIASGGNKAAGSF
jgi:hypothetical protein